MAERDYKREYDKMASTPERREKYRKYQREYRRRQRAADPEFVAAERAAGRAYAKANPEKIVQINAKQYEKKRTTFGGMRYGISAEEYAERIARDCEICGENLGKGIVGQHLDHDHVTGELRGTLCRNCNIGLGMFKDDAERLANSINYLNRYSRVVLRKTLRVTPR